MDDHRSQLDISPADGEGRDTRKQILQEGFKEFAEHGVAGARVDRIARRAGVNKALIYYYYSSKQELYETSIREYMTETISLIRRELHNHEDLETALRGIADQYRMFFLQRPEIPRLLLRELANPESKVIEVLAQTIKSSGVPEQLRMRLVEGRKDGTLREVDIFQAVVSFITMQVGYFLMAPLIDRVTEVSDRQAFVNARRDAVVDLFLNGVRAR